MSPLLFKPLGGIGVYTGRILSSRSLPSPLLQASLSLLLPTLFPFPFLCLIFLFSESTFTYELQCSFAVFDASHFCAVGGRPDSVKMKGDLILQIYFRLITSSIYLTLLSSLPFPFPSPPPPPEPPVLILFCRLSLRCFFSPNEVVSFTRIACKRLSVSFFLSFFLCLAFLFLFLCVCYLSSPSVLLTCRVDQCCHCRSNVLDRIRSLWCTGRGWRGGGGEGGGNSSISRQRSLHLFLFLLFESPI